MDYILYNYRCQECFEFWGSRVLFTKIVKSLRSEFIKRLQHTVCSRVQWRTKKSMVVLLGLKNSTLTFVIIILYVSFCSVIAAEKFINLILPMKGLIMLITCFFTGEWLCISIWWIIIYFWIDFKQYDLK